MKIELPDHFPFSTEITVRIGDINYGRHLGNDAVLTLAHEARLRYLGQFDFSEFDAGGCAMIMLDSAIVYVSQAFLGDVLRAEVAVVESGRSGCEFFYRMTKVGDGSEVARVRTGLAFFDYERNRPARMPELFRKKMLG